MTRSEEGRSVEALPVPVFTAGKKGYLYAADIVNGGAFHIAPWEGIRVGQRIWTKIVARQPRNGVVTRVVWNAANVNATEVLVGCGSTIPFAWFDALEAGTTLSIEVAVAMNGSTNPADAVTFPEGTYSFSKMVPPIFKQHVNGTLYFGDLDGDAIFHIAPWDGIQKGQKVWARIDVKDSSGSVRTRDIWIGSSVSDSEVVEGCDKAIERSWLGSLEDFSILELRVDVTMDGSSDEAKAMPFPLGRYVFRTIENPNPIDPPTDDAETFENSALGPFTSLDCPALRVEKHGAKQPVVQSSNNSPPYLTGKNIGSNYEPFSISLKRPVRSVTVGIYVHANAAEVQCFDERGMLLHIEQLAKEFLGWCTINAPSGQVLQKLVFKATSGDTNIALDNVTLRY